MVIMAQRFEIWINVIKQTPPILGSSSKRAHNIPRLREFFSQKLQKTPQKRPKMVIMAQWFEIRINVIKQTPPRLASSSKRAHNIPRLRDFFSQKLQKTTPKWPKMVIMAQRFQLWINVIKQTPPSRHGQGPDPDPTGFVNPDPDPEVRIELLNFRAGL